MLLLFCGGCRRGPSPDAVEVARLRAEQAALKERVEALEQKLDEPRPASAPPGRNEFLPAPPSSPPPVVEHEPTAARAPVPELPEPLPTSAVPASPRDVPRGDPQDFPRAVLRTEDLHGRPVESGLPVTDSLGLPDDQAAALLQQLKGQLDLVKQKQGDQAAALEALEKIH